MNSCQSTSNRPVYSSTITIEKSVKNGFDDDSQLRQMSANPAFGSYNAPLSGMERSSMSSSHFSQQNTHRKTPSDLTDNLSTLESMLQDLDSVQGYSHQNQNSLGRGVNSRSSIEQTGLKQIHRTVEQSQFMEHQQPPMSDLRNFQLDEIDSRQGLSRGGPVRVAGQDQILLPQEKLLAIPDLQQMRLGQGRPVVMSMTELRRETTNIPGGYEEHSHYQYIDQGYAEGGNQPRVPLSNVQTREMSQTVGQSFNSMPQLGPSTGFQQTVAPGVRNTGMLSASPAAFEQHQQYQYYSQQGAAQGFTGVGHNVSQPPPVNVPTVDANCTIIGQGMSNNNVPLVQGSTFEQGSAGRKAGMSTASRDLEDLMTSISEFDAYVAPSSDEASLLQIASSTKTNNNSVATSNAGAGSADQSKNALTYGLDATDQNQNASSAAGANNSRMINETILDSGLNNVRQPVPSPQIVNQASKSSIVVVSDGQRQDIINGGIVGMSSRREAMLVKLDGDAGELTLPRGNCAACNNAIVGQVLLALGKVFHPEHFACAHCKQQLGTNIFYERDGQPFCERDYLMLFSPKCGGCNGAILEKCITAVNKSWHPEHFLCAACGQQFGDAGFHEKDGKVYCSADYFAMFAPTCGGCNKAILHNYISALHNQWHPECFVCRECGSSFDSGSFYDHDGFPFCEKHFHAKRGSLCASCNNPIIGRCIAAMYKKYHPEHFICSFCLHPLNKGTFKEHSDKPYCHPCFDKLFG